MTTAVLRIAKASVGEGTGIKRPSPRRFEAVIGTISHESLCISVLIERDRVIGRAAADLCWFCRGRHPARARGRLGSLYIGAAVIAGAGLNRFCEQGEL